MIKKKKRPEKIERRKMKKIVVILINTSHQGKNLIFALCFW